MSSCVLEKCPRGPPKPVPLWTHTGHTRPVKNHLVYQAYALTACCLRLKRMGRSYSDGMSPKVIRVLPCSYAILKYAAPSQTLGRRFHYSLFTIFMKTDWGMCTLPLFCSSRRFLPSFCFCNSLFLRDTSPP